MYRTFSFLKISIFSIVYLNLFVITLPAQIIELPFTHTAFHDPDIYVITNRQIDTLNTKFLFTNIVNTNPALTFFRVNASCTDSLCLTKLDSISFLTEILKIEKQDWLLFIHGDSKTFEQAVIRGLIIQNTYKVRVIVFAWPSKDFNLSGSKNFKNSHKNVEKSINHFNSVLGTMYCLRNSNNGFLGENKLSLFIHSLGNYYLECMVKSNLWLKPTSILFDNIILNAAAVEQKNHKKWVEQLQFQKNIFISKNKHDFNLKGLRIFTEHGKQLGEKVKYPFANNALYFNFSKSVGFRIPTGVSHTYFIGKIPEINKNIYLFYLETIHGLCPNLTDEIRFKKRRGSLGDVLVR